VTGSRYADYAAEATPRLWTTYRSESSCATYASSAGAAMVLAESDSAAICTLAAHAPQRVIVGVDNNVMGGGAAP
jgi:hypothetical protein